jgi:alkylation response protein AidB-like acyl-CoA dehydrogenase
MSGLTEQERDEFAETARRLLTEGSSSERVRAAMETPHGHDRALWNQIAELGWLSIHIPEDRGGMGGSFSDTAIMLHEAGRQLMMGPLLGSAVLASAALLWGENESLADQHLPAMTSGERVLTVALANPDGSYQSNRLGPRWTRRHDGLHLSGTAAFVLDAGIADGFIVLATDETGSVTAVLIDADDPGVRVEMTPTMDLTRRVGMVTLDVVVDESRLLVEAGRAGDLCDRLVALGVIGSGLDTVGAAEQMMERSAAYAREREQFGRPIGSFQAIKHHCANMLVSVEASRAIALYAAELFDAPTPDLIEAAGAVASFARPACAEVCRVAVLVHGGIGFTWEHDAHMFLKRSKLNEALFGRASWHRRRLADRVLAPR